MRVFAVLLALGACGSSATGPAAATQTTVPATAVAETGIGLYPGENMSFTVNLAGVLVGEAALVVGALEGEESKTISVRSRIASSGAAAFVIKFLDDATTKIDAATGLPLTLTTEVQQDKRSYRATAEFSKTGAKVVYQAEGRDAQNISFDFKGRPVHDAHSAMARLRHWRPQPGGSEVVYIVGGRRLWRINLTYVGSETIATTVGNRKAVKLDGLAYRARADLSVDGDKPGRTFTVWLSDDADRVPIRLVATTELGDVEMQLAEYNHE